MATYPIKMLRDEDRQPFVPFTSAAGVSDSNGVTLQELMDNGKYKIQNNVTTSQAGKGVLDAYQGKVLNDNFSNYVPLSQKGVANGVATLDGEAKVPSSQLPSYVDDVIEAYIRDGATALSSTWLSLTDGGAALTPEKGKIYLIMTTGDYQNKQYRWGGSVYVLCNPSDVNSVNGFTGVVVLKELTIQKNGVQVGDAFNGSADKTINLSIPTKTSDVTNDSGFITAADDITGNAATATNATNATNDSDGNAINTTYVKKAGNVTITGIKTFSTAGGFAYSGIETSSSDSDRAVWYGKSGNNGIPTINASQFTYNPGTDVLTVGNVAGNAATATKLAASKTINGTSFDGSDNITTANWGTPRNMGIVNSDGTGTAVTVAVDGSQAVNLKLPASIKADITGDLTGNADTATVATGDKNGLDITNYIKGLSINNNNVITYTKGDDTTGTIAVSTTGYTLPIAGTGVDGTLGGVKVGSGLSIDSSTGVLSATGGGIADNVEWSGVLNKPTNVSYWTNDANYITLANVMGGATASTAGTAGVVPAPGSGDQAKFLRGDGQWAAVSYATTAGTANATSGTLTIQKNGSNVATFNGSAATANILVPVVYTGTSTPSASTGVNGDIYIQTS